MMFVVWKVHVLAYGNVWLVLVKYSCYKKGLIMTLYLLIKFRVFSKSTLMTDIKFKVLSYYLCTFYLCIKSKISISVFKLRFTQDRYKLISCWVLGFFNLFNVVRNWKTFSIKPLQKLIKRSKCQLA